MSMSDTAEYWWDVKAKRHYHGPTFRHAHGYDCSHLKWCNNRVTKYLLDVKEAYEYKLAESIKSKLTPEELAFLNL